MRWCRHSSTFTPLWVGLGSEVKILRKNHASQDYCKAWFFLCARRNLFLFHHGSDFLGLHGVDVAIGIAEAEGTIVAATHCKEALHRKVEATHQFLGEGRNFILLGIHSYCCHIV